MIPARWFGQHASARLCAFFLDEELANTRSTARDLRALAELIADGLLDPQVAMEQSWDEAAPALRALLERRVAGKAVLHIASRS